MTLEQKIATALVDDNATSDQLAELIKQVEDAANAAEEQVKEAREAALDLNAKPDEAAAAVASAEIMLARLDANLPKLDQRYQNLAGREKYVAWSKNFDAVAVKHANAIKTLTAAVQHLPELIEAFALCRNVDAEVRNVMRDKPTFLAQANGDDKNLPSVECAARGVGHIDAEYSLANMKISYSNPTAYDWPPSVNFAAETVAAMHFPSGPGPNWFEDIAKRNAARAEDAKRMNKFYETQTREREAREAEQAKADRAARQAAR